MLIRLRQPFWILLQYLKNAKCRTIPYENWTWSSNDKHVLFIITIKKHLGLYLLETTAYPIKQHNCEDEQIKNKSYTTKTSHNQTLTIKINGVDGKVTKLMTTKVWEVISEILWWARVAMRTQQTTRMEVLAKIVKNFQPLTTFIKNFILDVRSGSKYASVIDYKNFFIWWKIYGELILSKFGRLRLENLINHKVLLFFPLCV